jgi:hypothetical protein
MAGSLIDRINGGRGRGERREARSPYPIEGIVVENDDPEFQQRIMAKIPALDENVVWPKWVRPLGVFCLGPGYGSFFPPAIGSEVFLFSRLGDKHNLFYASTYNEDYIVPEDFRDPAVAGIRTPGQLKLIADQLMQLRGSRLRIEADASIQITAPGGVFINNRQY